MSDPQDKSISSRWAKRKQAVREAEAVENASDDAELDENLELESTEVTREQQLEQLNQLTDEDMPELETLEEEADFSGFMSKGVSDQLRKQALKKLFHGASYNLRDGLDEYDDDYTFFEKLDPNTITADMKHMIEVEAEKERKLLEEQALQDQLEQQHALSLEESEDDDVDDAQLAEGDDSEIDSIEPQSEALEMDSELNEEHQETEPDAAGVQTASLNQNNKTLH